jgi:hypothetical protein
LPVDHEPVFYPKGEFIPLAGIPMAFNGPVYDHKVPVFIPYASDRPAVISLRIGIHGADMVWNGGWQSNACSDTVVLEIANDTQGRLMGVGKFFTASGVYY